MNSIRQTQALNKRELENAVPPSASWHADYRDTAYVYIGGLPFDVSEGDIVTIFSQYGNPTHVNLIRDKETGKSKGFAFLKYEDQRSCDLAVDNLGGAEVLGRMLRVDHTRYKKRDDEDEEGYRVEKQEEQISENENGKRKSEDDATDEEEERRKGRKKRRPSIKEERELEELLQIKEGEEKDPMREYLIKEKRVEIERAPVKVEKKERKHKHHHHRHRDHDEDEERSHRRRDRVDESEHRSHRHRGRNDKPEEKSRRRRSQSSGNEDRKPRDKDDPMHEDRRRDRRQGERDH